MPQEWRRINGRWQLTGGQSADDLEAFIPADQPQQAAGKPAAKPKPKPRPKPQGFMQQLWNQTGGKLVNDVTYELRQLRQDPARSAQRLAGNAVPLLIRAATGQGAANPNLIAPLGAGAGDNALRMAYSLFQRHVQRKPQADPSAGPVGRFLDANVDLTYRLLGAKPPSEMAPAERDFDMLARSVGLNVGLGFIPGAGLGAAAATTRLGSAVRGAGALGLNEVLSNFLDDNTGGNIINLANDLGGLKLPGAVNVGQDDMVTAANKSMLPNAAPGVALGAVGGFANLIRRKRAGRLVEEARNAKARLERAGVQEQAEDGTAQFTPEVMDPGNAPTFADANAMRERQLGMAPDAPAAAPPSPPAAALAPEEQIARNNEEIQKLQEELGEQQVAEPAPDAPEADGLLRMTDELDDEELQAVAAAPGPVVENVNQTLQGRPEFTPNPAVRLDTVAAPTDRLSQLYLDGAGGMEPWAREIEAIPVDQLRSLVFPGNDPDLAARIMARTGKQFNELTRDDILELVRSLNLDGQTVLPNRMAPGQSVVRTSEIDAEPETFQFKQGVNEAGEQAGNSLDGVDMWDPNSEGVIQVWRSPVDGRMKVVNGHNRLALAKRLGIPSLRVEELVATTPEAARAKGAIANINDGKGTPFDAAKFIRETGVADEAGMQRAGMPPNSGFAKDGLALSKLPDDLFQQAINEQLGDGTLGKAVLIGESGLDPESMRSAWRMALNNKRMTNAVLREVMAYNRANPTTAAAQVADQGDLLKGTSWDMSENPTMAVRAELAAAVRKALAEDKNLFKTIGNKSGRLEAAGNTINRTGARQISEQAARGLNAFDELKYVSGPVGELLNRGVNDVLAGAKPGAVAQQIKDELAQAIEATMAKEAAQQAEAPPAAAMPTDPGQGSLLPEEPAPARPLTADEREAMKIDIVRRAAAQGEIRPSATPEPELPEPARVEIEEALADIEARGGIEPGTPGAQALADEIRLAREYDLQDAAMRQDQEDALRDAYGYELKTFEEKKELGMVDGWDPEDAAVVAPVDAPDGRVASAQRPSPSLPTLPPGTTSAQAAKEIKEAAKDIARLVGGGTHRNKIVFQDDFEASLVPPEWGGDGVEMGIIRGWYSYTQDVIKINGILVGEPFEILETAAHEAFHRLQFRSLSAAQMKILDSPAARARIDGIAGALGMSDVSYLEQQAVVFQKYAMAKLSGKDPVAELFDLVARQTDSYDSIKDSGTYKFIKKLASIFDAVADYVQKANNYLKGNGFQSVRSIYDQAATGALARQPKEAGDGLLADIDMEVSWRQSSAAGEIVANAELAPRPTRPTPLRLVQRDSAPPPKPAPRRVDNENRARIEANNQAMDALRQKAMKEGC